MPFFAPFPLATIIATGVARAKAHGHDITSTDIARCRLYPISPLTNSHTISVINAIVPTTGTNIPDTLSASFAIGAFVEFASVTVLII